MAFCFIRTCTRSKGSIGRALKHLNITVSKRSFTFSYNGPRKLDDLMKTEAIEGKTSIELADIWYTYHEEKVRRNIYLS